MVGRAHLDRLHFGQRNRDVPAGQLPGGFTACQSGADDLDLAERHASDSFLRAVFVVFVAFVVFVVFVVFLAAAGFAFAAVFLLRELEVLAAVVLARGLASFAIGAS